MDFWATCRMLLNCSDADTRRMTPAKLMALLDKRLDDLELRELAVVRLCWLYVNSNRDPGDSEKGRPPAPEIPFEEFKTFRRKKDKSLAAKDVGGEHNWRGAKASRSAFLSWAEGKTMGKG